MKSPTSPGGGGGIGIKCKKIFGPKTRKISPSRTRAIMVTIFIRAQWSDWLGIPIPILLGQTADESNHHFRLNSSFKSAEGALLARRLNVPFFLMS